MKFPILAVKITDFEAKVDPWGKAIFDFFSGAWVVFVVGAVVLGALILWVKFLRRRRKRITGGEKVYRPGPSPPAEAQESTEFRRRFKRRVRRRGHRGRNPTIAETGGLPPVRSEQHSDPT